MTNLSCISSSSLVLTDRVLSCVCRRLRKKPYGIPSCASIDEPSLPCRKKALRRCSQVKWYPSTGKNYKSFCLQGVSTTFLDEEVPKHGYHVRRRQVRSFVEHDSKIKERISGGNEVKRGNDMTGLRFSIQTKAQSERCSSAWRCSSLRNSTQVKFGSHAAFIERESPHHEYTMIDGGKCNTSLTRYHEIVARQQPPQALLKRGTRPADRSHVAGSSHMMSIYRQHSGARFASENAKSKSIATLPTSFFFLSQRHCECIKRR